MPSFFRTFWEVAFLKHHLPLSILPRFCQTPLLSVIVVTLYFENKWFQNNGSKHPVKTIHDIKTKSQLALSIY